MFLKSMTLKGFKSFADSTILDFEHGVAVVVGPNGSGKSNVVDAIAWVLGAQAPASVRSQKMDDVIFAGTAKRAALGRAEVALTIDNSSKLLPIDFEEVTIKRTLFRDGESEYAMNEVPCRLMDIQELLSDTGVGRHQHVIVSQGQIDAVLNAKPEDRRTIIEEAAGILKYRRRKEKSQRRLKSSEENLTRLQDLVREVKRQLKPLERQAEAARTHGTLALELSTLQIHLAGKEITALREAIRAVQAGRQDHSNLEKSLRAKLRVLDSDIENAEDQLASTGTGEASDQLAHVEGLRERAKGLKALLSERIIGLQRELDRRLDGGVVETLEAESVKLQEELLETLEKAKLLEPSTSEVAEAEKDLNKERLEFQQKLFEEISPNGVEAAEARGKLAAINSSIEALQASRINLREKIVNLKEDEKSERHRLDELESKMVSLSSGIKELQEEIQSLIQSELLAEDEEKKTENLLAEAKLESKAWVSRADA
ncbi:MAG: AAA family ATPase, partial [Actinomycetota bacterium]|nr:AAA family ATPase [Actinomycetota bacterium]